MIPLQGIRKGKCTCQDWRDRNGKGTCGTPGKHPRFRNWPERATTDATEIEKWFSHDFKGSNVGIATGAASGVFVLDVDPKNGGEESLDRLQAKHGRLPATLQAMTGGGGRHFYFKHPGGTVPNEVSILPGLDIRGDGGQVVAAPSMHMSGRRYDWDGLDGFNAPILPAPAWLLDLIAPKQRAGKEPKEIPHTIPDGTKHKRCVSLAGSMRRRGCNSEEIYAALLKVAERFETPVPSENLRAIAEDIQGRYMPEAESDTANWRGRLITNRDGNPKPVLANAITALRLAPEWSGVLGFNEFSLGTVALKPAPWDGAGAGGEWTDHEDRVTANWLQHQGIFVSVDIAGQTVQSVAKDRRFHPVREYLDALTWDGTKRIDSWLSLYLGTETNDYTAAVGA
ncbi:MAG: bifunctional DNA primase/polymerase, partial [Acidobacteria bacterium]|nr:bifunctional DNA primase/polymerase [Acidobacteriota bacterium]